MNTFYPIILLLLFLFSSFVFAQLTFSGGSRLKDAAYFENQIKNISNESLFRALDLNRPELTNILHAVRKKDFKAGYEAWAAYWGVKQQPKYITQNYQLLIDTELLKSYEEMREYGQSYPAERDTILNRAGKILQHEIHTWGDVVIKFGPKVDFNREIGNSAKYGFHYWGWARPLNSAFVLTGDQKYLAEFDALFNQWYEQRNHITGFFPELNVVYYELGLGARNRVFIEHYFLPFRERTWQTHERMLKTILGAARWLYELQQWEGYRPGNWQIVGASMLAQIALVFPEFRESAAWLDIALQRLNEHLEKDFFEDGGHSERAPRNYTLLTYLSYRNLYYLLQVYNIHSDYTLKIRERMGKTIDWWLALLAPTGEIPAINDSHRGLFPVGILQDGAVFYKKPEVNGVLKNLFGIVASELVQLPEFTSRHLPASGFTIMRSDWNRDALYMNINYGKFSGFHTHNDMLDFEIYAYGKALAVDAGMALTYDDPQYISWYQSSRAHNMVVVNDENMERKDIEGENVIWHSLDSVEFFAAAHRGYAKFGVHHRRNIIFVKSRYWVIFDRLKCEKDGNTLSWYFHSPIPLVPAGLGFQSSSAPGILVLPASDRLETRTGKGFASSTDELTPGKTQEIDWIAYDQKSAANLLSEFNILLFPFLSEALRPEFTRNYEQHYVVRTAEFTDHLYLPTVLYDDGDVATDAVFLLIHEEMGCMSFSLVDGTFLNYKGKPIWISRQKSSSEGCISQ